MVPYVPPLFISLNHYLPLSLSPALSRAVGQAERDDNATVIRRETNKCDKSERRGKERRTIHHFEIQGDSEVCGALVYKTQVEEREQRCPIYHPHP